MNLTNLFLIIATSLGVMEKTSKDNDSIQRHIYSLLVPQEILKSFEIVSVEEKSDDLFFYLSEKEGMLPVEDLDLVQNGFTNPVELNPFPVAGKRCFLRLTRRKWKLRGSISKEIFTNTYDFTLEGTKATKLFGSFLKEFGL
jgi:hypothetical protein